MKNFRVPIWLPLVGLLASFSALSVNTFFAISGALEDSIAARKKPDSLLLKKVFTSPVPESIEDEQVKARVIRDAIGNAHTNTLVEVFHLNGKARESVADNRQDTKGKVPETAYAYARNKIAEWNGDDAYLLTLGHRFTIDGVNYHLIGQRFPLSKTEKGEVILITNLQSTIAKPRAIFVEAKIRTAVAVVFWGGVAIVINVAPIVRLKRQIKLGEDLAVWWWVPQPIADLAKEIEESRASIGLKSRMIEFSPVPTLICKLPKSDDQAIVTFANKAASQQYGYADMIGMTLNTIVPEDYWIYHTWGGVYDDELKRNVGMSSCPHAGESRAAGKQRAVPSITKDDRTLQTLLSVERIADDADGSRNFIGTLQNVTALVEATKEAESRRETMSVELGGFNHDVKNAIGGILKMYSSLVRSLEKRGGMDAFTERETQYLDRILASATRLHRLNEGMREIRKLEQRTLGSYTPWEVFNAVRQDFTGTDISWQQQEGFKVTCDLDKLSVNVLSNLIQNAKIYSGPNPTIQVRAAIDGNFGVFAVTDNGPGIPEAKQSVVFNLGAGSRLNQSIEGTGMGLYQARKAVESFGGKIWVRNNPDSQPGCTFFFSIPLAR